MLSDLKYIIYKWGMIKAHVLIDNDVFYSIRRQWLSHHGYTLENVMLAG